MEVSLEQSGVAKQIKKLHKKLDAYAKTLRPGCSKLLSEHNLHQAHHAIVSGRLPDTTPVQCEMFPNVSAWMVQ